MWDEQVEQEDVCQADPDSQPAPPIVCGLRQLMQDAIAQSLCVGWEYALCVGVPLVSLPVICNISRHSQTASSRMHKTGCSGETRLVLHVPSSS